MTAVNHGRIRQREKLGLYRGQEGGCVAARQIRAADGTTEEYVAPEDQTLTEKAYAPRRVSWGKPDRELGSAHADNLPRTKLPVRRRRPVELKTYPRPILRKRIVERTIERVEADRRTGRGVHGSHAHDVIYMTVSQPDLTQLPVP